MRLHVPKQQFLAPKKEIPYTQIPGTGACAPPERLDLRAIYKCKQLCSIEK
jgi:hypothetical protein